MKNKNDIIDEKITEIFEKLVSDCFPFPEREKDGGSPENIIW